MKLKHTGKIEQGQLILDDEYLFNQQKLSLEGKRIQMTLEKYKTQRSLRQNAFYWGVVIPIIGDWTGELEEDIIHNGLKKKFLGGKEIKGIEMVKSTKKLTTTEFELFIDKIRIWLMEEGINLPEPNQVIIN